MIMDLISDKSNLFRWDRLMNVAIERTRKIMAVPKNLSNGTKVFNDGLVKFVKLALH